MAITTAIAFSKLLRLMMSRGLRSALTASTSSSPARATAPTISSSSAAMVEEPGTAMPSASIAEDMVLAVYMPPQEPAPGQEWHSTFFSRASSILPAACWPTASKIETMVRSSPSSLPGLMVPP